jgi:hypothetical protein
MTESAAAANPLQEAADAAGRSAPAAVSDPSSIPPSSTPQLLSPEQRIEQSRQRMREWLEARRPRAARNGAEGPASGLMDKLHSTAVGGTLIDAFRSWWDRHPIRPFATAGEGALRDALLPYARRHPYLMVGGAMAVGALAMRMRLWRWFFKRAVFAGLFTQVAAQVVQRVPLDSLLAMFSGSAKDNAAEATAGTPMPKASDSEARSESGTPTSSRNSSPRPLHVAVNTHSGLVASRAH